MKIPLLVLCVLLGALNLAAETTDAILARMNEVALMFKGMSANVNMTTYTKVIEDKEVKTGTLQTQRLPGKSTRALLKLVGQGESQTVFLANDTVALYYPKLKRAEYHNVAKSSDVVNQYLLLGFGSSGKDLMENYEINNAGTEKIAGQDTTHLVLLPKSKEVKDKLAKVEFWIPLGKAYPDQQQYFEPNGNYRLITYTDIVINPPIKGNLEFKLPPGTKKE